jgi:hypothetical protein
MSGLENEVIFFVGANLFDESSTNRSRAKAIIKELRLVCHSKAADRRNRKVNGSMHPLELPAKPAHPNLSRIGMPRSPNTSLPRATTRTVQCESPASYLTRMPCSAAAPGTLIASELGNIEKSWL